MTPPKTAKKKPCKCQYEVELPVFMQRVELSLGHIGEKIDTSIAQQQRIDGEQFSLLRKHGEAISAVQKEVSLFTTKMKNGGIPATVKPSKEYDFWQTLAATKKKYLLFLCFGGGSAALFIIDFIIKVLTDFRLYLAALPGG